MKNQLIKDGKECDEYGREIRDPFDWLLVLMGICAVLAVTTMAVAAYNMYRG